MPTTCMLPDWCKGPFPEATNELTSQICICQVCAKERLDQRAGKQSDWSTATPDDILKDMAAVANDICNESRKR